MNLTITREGDAPEETAAPTAPTVTAQNVTPSDASTVPTSGRSGAPGAIGSILRDNTNAGDLGDLEELCDEGETSDGEVMHPVVLRGKRLFIRQLDVLSLLDVEAGRIQVKNNIVKRDMAREAKLGMALELVATVYKRVGEETYEPVFASTDAAQEFMGKPKNKRVVSELIAACYLVNTELSPQKKIAQAQALSPKA